MQKVLSLVCLIFVFLPKVSTSPNLVLFLTDDLDSELNGLVPLEKTRQWIGDFGVTLNEAFVTTPVCCPSRSSILTGLYQHNTHVVNNTVEGNCSSPEWQNTLEKRTIATELKESGYVTFYAGKYLNTYGHVRAGGVEHVPPGWDFWAGLVGNSKYYDYKLSINGKAEHHGSVYEEDYLTDVIGRKAESFFDIYFNESTKSPFFMVLSMPSPHAPFTPAPQYANHFANMTAPRTKSFNYIEDPEYRKHWFINTQPRPLNSTIVEKVDEVFRNRWRTLLSVDDLVDGVMSRLESEGVLDNTYVIFTSDHGFHLGQFALPQDKRQLYETDIRIPLLIRGPGIESNWSSNSLVASIDLTPTLIDMAGAPVPEDMDGSSFLPLIKTEAENFVLDFFWSWFAKEEKSFNDPKEQHSILISYHGEYDHARSPECLEMTDSNMSLCVFEYGCKCLDSRNNTYACVRSKSDSEDTVFCQFEDDEHFIEMYNLAEDRDQLFNLATKLTPGTKSFYEDKLKSLKNCRGRKECFTQ